MQTIILLFFIAVILIGAVNHKTIYVFLPLATMVSSKAFYNILNNIDYALILGSTFVIVLYMIFDLIKTYISDKISHDGISGFDDDADMLKETLEKQTLE
jgi:hypothetical protein